MNVLVTGGCGFIGSNIAENLLEDPRVKSVRILDNLITGRRDNIQFLLDKYENLDFMYGDIQSLKDCIKATNNMNLICHQAALGSVPRSMKNPLASHNNNVNGFLNILLAAKENNIKRIVYASSSSVYGDEEQLPKVEHKVGEVLSPYAATKAIKEIYGKVFTRCYGLECIGLRYFNVFGPRQNPNGAYAAVIPRFIDLIKSGKRPTINGDGNFSRDFTYIDNVVSANKLALFTDNSECFGQIINIAEGGRVTILEMFNMIKELLSSSIEPIFGEHRAGDIPHSNADISKAKSLIGYKPLVYFKEGIRRTLEYY